MTENEKELIAVVMPVARKLFRMNANDNHWLLGNLAECADVNERKLRKLFLRLDVIGSPLKEKLIYDSNTDIVHYEGRK